MIAQLSNTKLTPEEYLAFEEKSLEKHEYMNGEAYAMAGSTDDHNTICINAVGAINPHLGVSDCRVYMADMKAQLEACNCYYYPDLLVTCAAEDLTNATCKRFAKLIIEVLSPSTEAFDRGRKFANYQTLESLEEYVLIDTSSRRVEVFRRLEGGLWILQTYQEAHQDYQQSADSLEVLVEFKSIGLQIPLSLLYRNVRIETAEQDFTEGERR